MIKKYEQFLGKKTNEEFVDAPSLGTERAPSAPSRGTEVAPSRPATTPGTRPSRPSVVPTERPSEEDAPLAENPQEGSEYIGEVKMRELLNTLGDEAKMENNSISYNGKTINFYSETEKFHVGNKKFTTVEEVVNFLNKEQVQNKKEDRMDPEFEAKSYRLSRREKRIK